MSHIVRVTGDTIADAAFVAKTPLPQIVGSLTSGNYTVQSVGGVSAVASIIPAPQDPPASPDALKLVQEGRTGSVDMHMHGVYWFKHYDLEEMGALGAAVRNGIGGGNRYAILFSSDHFGADTVLGQHDGYGVMLGFANDPASLPENVRRILPERFDYTGVSNAADGFYSQNETPWLVYNPDDPSTPFWLYSHCNSVSDGAYGQETLLHKSADLLNWTFVSVSHRDPVAPNQKHAGYQRIWRRGTGDWVSFGLAANAYGWWSSTDGITFTRRAYTSGGGTYRAGLDIDGVFHEVQAQNGSNPFYIGGQLYGFSTIENRTSADDTEWTTMLGLFPVEETAEPLVKAEDDLVVLREDRNRSFPTLPDYIQSAHGLAEDGVLHIWVNRGYFLGIGQGALTQPIDTKIDYYAYVYDPTAAAAAAPSGVVAHCVNRAVTVSCNDVLPQSTYRLERGASASGPWTLVADSGPTLVDNAPTIDTLNFYRLTTLEGGVARGSRVVSVFAGAATSVKGSNHLTRIAKLGFDMTSVDVGLLEAAISWLASQGLTDQLTRWVNPAFGVKLSSGSSVESIADLASTLRPYWGGDAYAWQGSNNEGTLGTAAGYPAIVGGANTNYALGWGRFNGIRQRDHSGVSFGVVYDHGASSGEAYLMGYGKNVFDALFLYRTSNNNTLGVDWGGNGPVEEAAPGGYTMAMGHAIGAAGAQTLTMSVNAGARPAPVDLSESPSAFLRGESSDQSQRGPGNFVIGRQVTRRDAGVDDSLSTSGTARGAFAFTDAFAFGIMLTTAQEASLYAFTQTRTVSGGGGGSAIEKAIQADYGATGDGTTNENSAFQAFSTEHGTETGPVILNIEAGDYVTSGYAGSWFMRSFSNLTVRGAAPSGGLWTSTFLSGVRTGGGGQRETNDHSVRLATVNQGDTSLTVLAEDISGEGRSLADLVGLFPVGSSVFLTSYDMQGFGFPSNPGQCEFHRVTAANPATGVLTLDGAAQFTHSDDLPLYSSGADGGVDHGGPATLYAMNPEWPGRVTVENMEWVSPNQTYMAKEIIEYQNCKTDDIGPGNAVSVLINGGQHRKIEIDKLCETVTIRNADVSAPGFIQTQSSAPNLLTIEDTQAGRIDGTAREAVIRRTEVTQRFSIGVSGYGATQKVSLEDCVLPPSGVVSDVFRAIQTGDDIPGVEVVGGTLRLARHDLNEVVGSAVIGETITGATSGATATIAGLDGENIWLDVASLTNGPFAMREVITAPSLAFATIGPNTAGRRWAVPGSFLMLENANGFATGANITGMHQAADGANEIRTDATGFPAYALPFVRAVNHPCMDFSCTGMTGSDVAVSLNAHPANTPLGSVVRIWMGSDGVLRGGGHAIGKITSATVNVTKAYTGALSGLFFVFQRFDKFFGVSTVDGSERSFEIYPDLTEVGQRTWTAAGNDNPLGDDDTTEDCSIFLNRVIEIASSADIGLSDTKGGPLNDISGEDPSVWPEFEITLTLDPTWRP
ncbi:MAG: hypothetical protein AAGJ91_14810 [Pseudomonadota bacterium]